MARHMTEDEMDQAMAKKKKKGQKPPPFKKAPKKKGKVKKK
jgi:hypothetical protein